MFGRERVVGLVQRVASRFRAEVALRTASTFRLAISQREFLNFMSMPGQFGVMSAYLGPLNKSVNKRRQEKLIQDLQKLGNRKVSRFHSVWEGVPERSLLIEGITASNIFDLGRKYDQEAVVFKSKDGVVGMYSNKNHNAVVAMDPETGGPAFSTALGKGEYSKERNWSFTLNFLWDVEIPWDGKHVITPQEVVAYVAAQKR